jgi:hypothetical protein
MQNRSCEEKNLTLLEIGLDMADLEKSTSKRIQRAKE